MKLVLGKNVLFVPVLSFRFYSEILNNGLLDPIKTWKSDNKDLE